MRHRPTPETVVDATFQKMFGCRRWMVGDILKKEKKQ
jgi:hypothetical protein